MKKFSKSHHTSLSELNITPLLDLAFVLLVIFIITTTPMVNDLEINLPQAKNRPKDSPPKVNYVTVDKKGLIFLNRQAVDLTGLHQLLVEYRTADPDLNVVIRGDSGVEYKFIIWGVGCWMSFSRPMLPKSGSPRNPMAKPGFELI